MKSSSEKGIGIYSLEMQVQNVFYAFGFFFECKQPFKGEKISTEIDCLSFMCYRKKSIFFKLFKTDVFVKYSVIILLQYAYIQHILLYFITEWYILVCFYT